MAKKLPMNLILTGPPGTGKTTIAKIIVDSLYENSSGANVMEVNASDRVRMDFIRNDLKAFINQGGFEDGLKVVIMEESDNIPGVVQNALRRLMESSYKTCRFILTCNYLSNVISPIRSRCMTIRFRPVSAKGVIDIVSTILKKENLKTKESVVTLSKELNKAASGDMRLAINTLQICDLNDPINSIYDLLALARPIIIDSILLFLKKNKFSKILEKLNVMDRVSHRHFMKQLEDSIIKKEPLRANQLANVCLIFAEYDERLTLSGKQEVQLISLLARLCKIIGGGGTNA